VIADRIRSIQAVAGGGGGSFDPSQLSGLALWLKADTGVTLDGSGNVSSWADQSGNGRNATQTDAAKRPTVTSGGVNGLPSLVFSGAQTLLGSGALLANGVTAFIVAKYNSASGRSAICNLGTQNASSPSRIFAIEQNTFLSAGKLGLYTSSNSFDSSFQSSANQVRVTVASDLVSGSSVPSTTVYRVNGANQTLTSTSGGTLYDFNIRLGTNWLIGDIGSGVGYFSGKLSEIIVFDKKLSHSEILQVEDYLVKYGVDPNYDATSLILNMDGTPGSTTFADSSPNALAVTANGNAQIVSDATFGTVASFDGSGDYLSTPANSVFNYGTGDFTVELWVYKLSNKQYMTFAGNLSSGTNSNQWQIISDVTGNKLTWFSNGFAITSATSLATNTWYHVAVARAGSSLRLFINGVLDGSAVNTNNYSTTNLFMLGQVPELLSARDFYGKVGPTRITKGVARYTSSFTPPTGPFPAS